MKHALPNLSLPGARMLPLLGGSKLRHLTRRGGLLVPSLAGASRLPLLAGGQVQSLASQSVLTPRKVRSHASQRLVTNLISLPLSK